MLGSAFWLTLATLLGLCLGLQCLVIEVARNLAGLADANSTEFEPDTPHPVVSTMAEQRDVVAGERDMGGTMRLGAYPAVLVDGSLTAKIYGSTMVSERHRHRYEVNNAYRETLDRAGLHISGTSPDGTLVEFVELDTALHPFAVATQAHPELKSRPTRPHPLFAAFVRAALGYLRSERLPIEGDGDAEDATGDGLPDGAAPPEPSAESSGAARAAGDSASPVTAQRR